MRIYFYLFFMGLGSAWAQQCVHDPLAQYLLTEQLSADNLVYVQADEAEGDYQRAEFSGNVNIRHNEKRLTAPFAEYRHHEGKGNIPKDAVFSAPRVVVKGDEVAFDTNAETVAMKKANYLFRHRRWEAQGSADEIHLNQNTLQDELKSASWSTCGRINPTWHLQAERLDIDRQKGRAVARNLTFNIKNIPIFYLPYFSYPITNERTTGFLVPSARTGEAVGLELSIPYYFNIAPNQDATVTFRPMTKQGLMLDGEYRYLLSNKQYFQANATYLVNTKSDKRWSYRIKHEYAGDNWQMNTLMQQVSDADYPEDFRHDFNFQHDWYLEKHWVLKVGDHWQIRLQDHQIINSQLTEKPYARLPQIQFRETGDYGSFRYDIQAEAVYFRHRHQADGKRLHLKTSLSYPLETVYGYLTPKLTLNGTYYDLHGRDNLKRFLPTFSLDSGLFFERSTGNYLQTLEPRLFYVYTPYKNQADFPIFDSGVAGTDWHNLFRENSFTGSDRIADAHQLTTAVTTRLMRNRDGLERLRLSVGQIHYFRSPQVGLYGNRTDRQRSSLLAGEGEYHINRHLSAYGSTLYDTKNKQIQQNTLDLRYRLDKDRLFSVGHRFNRGQYQQVSLASIWRVHDQWKTFQRYDYSVREKRLLNAVVGVEYDDCCWAWRLAGKRARNSDSSHAKLENSLYFEFIFKGLGNMGKNASSLLKSEIREFKPQDD